MARIAIAGFMHETNTFAPLKATWDDFVRAEGFPGLTLGEDILRVFPSINIGIGGFLQEAQQLGHALLSIAWCESVPSSYVTVEAFENMSRIILEGLREREAYDALYLDLHGAMVTEHYEDGEGELLRRIRQQVGPELPIVASLDLHSNTTAAMLEHSDGLVAYRTYPHVDMADTGRRAARYLDQLLRLGKPAKARQALPFLMPLTGQCTLLDPNKSVYRHLEHLERETPGLRNLSFTCGFPPADIWDCGPVVTACADSQAIADQAVAALTRFILDREADYEVAMLSPDAAVMKAMRSNSLKPYVLADVQDNCGAGATSDTTGLLAALVRNQAHNAVLGVLVDGEAAAAAHAAGLGAEIDIAVGGKLFKDGDPPFRARFRVTGLSDGRFRCTGPFYKGVNANLGPMAVLTAGGVSVVVSTNRMQAADQEIFRHIGIEPKTAKILGLKSTVHFRGDFTDLAEEILVVEAPGAFIDRPDQLPYRRLRPGVRRRPRDARA
ncbi:MAG: M81 family metallopeptidase [Gammaproteobacteria bacterium]